jgi:hypothetical protein
MEFLLQPLTLVTFFPLLGVLVLLFLPSENKNLLRWTALVTSLVTFGISLWVLSLFNASNPDLQPVAKYDWITVAGWNIQYHMGVDGLSILLVLLTAFPDPPSRSFRPGQQSKSASRISCSSSCCSKRACWALPGSGPVPFLYFLGIHARADVFPHLYLGFREKRLLSN